MAIWQCWGKFIRVPMQSLLDLDYIKLMSPSLYLHVV